MKVTKLDNGMIVIDGETAVVYTKNIDNWLTVSGMPSDHITTENFVVVLEKEVKQTKVKADESN